MGLQSDLHRRQAGWKHLGGRPLIAKPRPLGASTGAASDAVDRCEHDEKSETRAALHLFMFCHVSIPHNEDGPCGIGTLYKGRYFHLFL